MCLCDIHILFKLNSFFSFSDAQSGGDADFSVYSAFQSHESEFDYLKSQEIEEKINKIKWLRQYNASNFLLATNGMYKSCMCTLL